MMRAAWCQGQSQFAGYYCYRGEPVVRLAGEAPFRYAGHAQVVNGEQAAAQLIIFREARQGGCAMEVTYSTSRFSPPNITLVTFSPASQ